MKRHPIISKYVVSTPIFALCALHVATAAPLIWSGGGVVTSNDGGLGFGLAIGEPVTWSVAFDDGATGTGGGGFQDYRIPLSLSLSVGSYQWTAATLTPVTPSISLIDRTTVGIDLVNYSLNGANGATFDLAPYSASLGVFTLRLQGGAGLISSSSLTALRTPQLSQQQQFFSYLSDGGANSIYFNVTDVAIVPEPSSATLLLLNAAVLFSAYRRRGWRDCSTGEWI